MVSYSMSSSKKIIQNILKFKKLNSKNFLDHIFAIMFIFSSGLECVDIEPAIPAEKKIRNIHR